MEKSAKKMTILSLALPILAELVLRNLMGTVNVFLLSRYSDDAVAAVGVANQIINVAVIAFTMISAGAAVVINQTLGAGKQEEAGQTAANALGAMSLLGLAASLLLVIFAQSFVRLLGLEEALVPDAAAYLRITGAASVFLSLSSMLSCIFRCNGSAHIPMATVLLNNLLNLFGTALIIFRPFEIPLYGVPGVACIRALSELAGVVLLSLFLRRSRFRVRIYDIFHIQLKKLSQIVRIGLMSGMEGICYTLGQVVTTGFLTGFGAAALSAKVYVQNIDYYAYVVGLSIGQAMQILAGHSIGAGEEDAAYRLVNHSYLKIVLSNFLFGLNLFVFSTPLLHLFTQDTQIISIARSLLFVDIFIHLGRALNHTFNYGLRSAGYVFWPMVIAVASIWLFNVGGGYVFSTVFSFGALGLWLAQALDEWVRGLTVMTLWLKRKWSSRKAAISDRR